MVNNKQNPKFEIQNILKIKSVPHWDSDWLTLDAAYPEDQKILEDDHFRPWTWS